MSFIYSDWIFSRKVATETVLLGFIWFLSVIHSRFYSKIAKKKAVSNGNGLKKACSVETMVITSAPHKDILMWIVISLARQRNCYDVREWSKVEAYHLRNSCCDCNGNWRKSNSWSLTSWGSCRWAKQVRNCCSSWSLSATSAVQPWSHRTFRSRNGRRPSEQNVWPALS